MPDKRRQNIVTLIIACYILLIMAMLPRLADAANEPLIGVAQSMSAEPLLGGQVTFDITIQNGSEEYVTDKGFNLTITDTLPAGLTYVSAVPAPTVIGIQEDGTTVIIWDNISDLEYNEAYQLAITADIDPAATVGTTFTNVIDAAVNTVPDNSGAWVTAQGLVTGAIQAIDIEAAALQSTADEQATGAGEYDASADWPYQYRVTIQNNNVGSTENVVAHLTLPPGVAYLGMSSGADPSLSLEVDGSLKLTWALGTLTTVNYDSPVEMLINTAIPHNYRTSDDSLAVNGPFAGPMSGNIIPEDDKQAVSYEATGNYSNNSTSDGTESTPDDDTDVTITAEYITVSKSATPKTFGIGSTITFSLNYYVSEYYTTTNVVLTDQLPDGMTYVNGSASLTPLSVIEDTPGDGQTTIVWQIPAENTEPGMSGGVTFQAIVDPTYEAAPYTDAPIVSGDSLTNIVDMTSQWADAIVSDRFATSIPDQSKVKVQSRNPSLTKDVWDGEGATWVDSTVSYVGDTLSFRLQYAAAADIDAHAIVIRDYLPRGMTFVSATDAYSTSGVFASGLDCTAAPTTPVIGWSNGLQYIEWVLCDTDQGSTWEVTFDAIITDSPDVQPNWIVANFGKLSGMNTFAQAYSLRDLAVVDYVAPHIVLTKSADRTDDLIADDVVNYTITIVNSGEAPAYNIVVTDIVPADIYIANNGGSAAPINASYSSTGDPASGAGGTLTWATLPMLAVGETQTFSYSGTIPQGLPAGYSLTNLASAAYNSRSDNSGRQTDATTNVNDHNSDDEIIYLKGLTISKSADRTYATIGDIVNWQLEVTVPAGLIGYWPVVEENNLPRGFDYVPGSTVMNGATLDIINHASNPLDNGNMDLRWFLETVDNTFGSSDFQFTIDFATLVTGVDGNNISILRYTNNCCIQNADNDAYVGWYDTPDGYNNQGFAFYGTNTGNIDRRSREADADVEIRQPNLLISKQSSQTTIGAGDTFSFTIEVSNLGNDIAYDITLTDTLPTELTYLSTSESTIIYPDGFPSVGGSIVNTNTVGVPDLSYELDYLYVGGVWRTTYLVQADADLSAALTMDNVAQIAQYSSQRGDPGDTNGDTLVDERVYVGPTAVKSVISQNATILKESYVADELTFSSSVVFTLTVPEEPLTSWMYHVVVTDVVDSRLAISGVTNGMAVSNTISASFPLIPPGGQETIVISALLPANSDAVDGDIITNQAQLRYDHSDEISSNQVAHTVVSPALMIQKQASTLMISTTETVTYTLTVVNVGQGRAENITISDTLPINMSFLNGVTGAWTLASLAGGQSHVISYTVDVLAATAGTPYINQVTVVGSDSMGNLIPADAASRVPADTDLDDTANAIVYGPLTCESEQTTVAYEDLKNVGWADWDYNDVVMLLDINQCLTSASELGIAEIDYEIIARGAGYNHDFRHDLPVNGGGQYILSVYDENGTLVTHIVDSFADTADFSIFTQTKDALAEQFNLSEGHFTNTLPEQTYVVDGYSARLTVLMTNPALNSTIVMPRQPWDPYLAVYDTGEEVHLVIPGHLDNMQTVNGVYDPNNVMIGHSLPLAQTFDPSWQWPVEYLGIWHAYPQYETFIATGETQATEWVDFPDTTWLWTGNPGMRAFAELVRSHKSVATSRYYGSPVVADMDNDGHNEIVVGNLVSNQIELYAPDGSLAWAQPVGGGIKTAVTMADLNNDGDLEMIFGTDQGQIFAYHHNGYWLSGWPVLPAAARVLAQPAVADIDGDDQLDVVVPLANGRLYVHNADGTAKWDASIGDVADQFGNQLINSSPVIADLDGDGTKEIVVGSYDGHLYAFDAAGNELWRVATGDVILSTPAVADIDQGRPGLESVIGSGDGYVYLVAANGELIWSRPTGWIVKGSPLAVDMDGDEDLEIVIGSGSNYVFAWHHTGDWVTGWPQGVGADISSTPVAVDVTEDGVSELLVAANDGRVYAWHMSGAPVSAWSYAAESALKSAPVILDVDGDQQLNMIAADFSGNLYIWDVGEGPTIFTIFVPVVTR